MGLFDNIRKIFSSGNQDKSPEQFDTSGADKIPPHPLTEPPEASSSVPDRIPLSPLPDSLRGMEKGRNIDRLGMMEARHIGFGPSFGPDQEGFWDYKGRSKDEYIEMASQIPEVRDRLNNGESLETLMKDPRLGACATQYFDPDHMVKVERMPDGGYEFSTGGRHRIAAAQELGIEIPVQVNEYGNKDGYSISPWEKQERYDALMDYMNQHNYSEADRAAYETDPEWQRLHREYDHPVNDWEKPELSDWEKDANEGLEKLYREKQNPASIEAPDQIEKTDIGDRNNSGGERPYAPFDDNNDGGGPKPPFNNNNHNGGSSNLSKQASLRDRYQSSYDDRIRQTPSLESNRWAGERGESLCQPKSDVARQIMEARGISGVQYQDGVPDFSPFSESTVKLGYMTDERHNRGLVNGRDGNNVIYAHYDDGEMVSSSHRADKDSMADLHMKFNKPGNFEQADILTAEQWTADGKDGKEWTAADVAQYRADNGLTWHECNDKETMQMIPEAINADFGHLGGVGEIHETDRVIDEALRGYNEEEMTSAEDIDRMSPEELDALERDFSKGHYDEDGVWIPEPSTEEIPEPADEDVPEAIDEPAAEKNPEMIDNPMGEDNPETNDVPAVDEVLEDIEEPVEEEVPEGIEEPVAEENPEEIEEPVEEEVPEGIEEPVAEETPEEIEEPIEEETSEEIEEPIEEETSEEIEEPVEEEIPEDIEESVDEELPEETEEPVEEEIPEDIEEPIEDETSEEIEEPIEDETSEEIEEPIEEEIPEEIEEPIEDFSENEEDYSDLADESDIEDIAETEDYSDLADGSDIEDAEETEDYSDLADDFDIEDVEETEDFDVLADDSDIEPIEEAESYDDFTDDTAVESIDDSADYSDFADGGSFDDTASVDSSFDSGSFDDGGSFDSGGGDSIE